MNRLCLEKIAEDVGFGVVGTQTWGSRILLELKAVETARAKSLLDVARGLPSRFV